MLGHESTRPAAGMLDLDTAPRQGPRAVGAVRRSTSTPTLSSRTCRSASSSASRSSRRWSRDAKVLILDEPTAVLTPQETDELIEIMRQLAAAGTSIVFITHKLREVRAVADVITVIRRGKVVGTAAADGRRVGARRDDGRPRGAARRSTRRRREPGEIVLSVRDLLVLDGAGTRVVDDVSFDLRARRDPRLRGRPGERPVRARRGDRRPDDAAARVDHAGRHRAGRALRARGARRRASGSSPRTARTTGSSGSSAWRRTWCSTSCTTGGSAAALAVDLAARRRERPSSGSRSTTSAPRGPRSPPAGCRAATSRRSCVARELSRPLQLFIAQPADARRRRRVDRVPAPPDRARAGLRDAGDPGLDRARRGARAGRPHRRDVPREGSSASCRGTPPATCWA